MQLFQPQPCGRMTIMSFFCLACLYGLYTVDFFQAPNLKELESLGYFDRAPIFLSSTSRGLNYSTEKVPIATSIPSAILSFNASQYSQFLASPSFKAPSSNHPISLNPPSSLNVISSRHVSPSLSFNVTLVHGDTSPDSSVNATSFHLSSSIGSSSTPNSNHQATSPSSSFTIAPSKDATSPNPSLKASFLDDATSLSSSIRPTSSQDDSSGRFLNITSSHHATPVGLLLNVSSLEGSQHEGRIQSSSASLEDISKVGRLRAPTEGKNSRIDRGNGTHQIVLHPKEEKEEMEEKGEKDEKGVFFRNATWKHDVGAWLQKCSTLQNSTFAIVETLSKRSCPKNCSGNGLCNRELGECRCFHGYNGTACDKEVEYECNLPRHPGDGAFGRWIESMCAASCHKQRGWCLCGEGTKYPQRQAAEQCGFTKREEGTWLFDWNQADLNIYSITNEPYGWCNLDPEDFYSGRMKKKPDCFCPYEGTAGELCENITLSSCYNQCSGNGFCRYGFCDCVDGWYGLDCSTPSGISNVTQWPLWISSKKQNHFIQIRKKSGKNEIMVQKQRPLIYIYDLPPEFNNHLIEGRHFKMHCVARVYDNTNSTNWMDQLYGAENALLESLLASKHRTNNAKEADFFYVPVLGACAIERARGSPHMGYEEKFMGLRTYIGGDLYRRAYEYIKKKYPYWNQSQGRDHLWFFPWDEGACVSPKEIWNSIMVVHWGNTNSKHNISTSQYPWDTWSLIPQAWRGNHPCFEPKKDIVVPSWKYPDPFPIHTRMVHRPPSERPTLFFFRGNLGGRFLNGRPEPGYSMGIRQSLAKYYASEPDLEGHLGLHRAPDVRVVNPKSADYSNELATSRFCGVVPGDGWSGRTEDAILHGCIPVIIQDGIYLPFEGILDYDTFSVRILEDDIPDLVNILRNIPMIKVVAMQLVIQKLWQRFTYHECVKMEAKRQEEMSKSLGLDRPPAPWAQEYTKLSDDDAFTTFIQVLNYKMSQQQWRVKSKNGRQFVDCPNYSYQL